MTLSRRLRKEVSTNLILKPSQVEVLKESPKNILMNLGTSSGKTLMSLHHFLKWNQGERLLIIAPPSKIFEGGWDDEIKFMEERYSMSIPYEILSYGQLRLKKFKDRIKDYKGYFIIFDECQNIKTPTSNTG